MLSQERTNAMKPNASGSDAQYQFRRILPMTLHFVVI